MSNLEKTGEKLIDSIRKTKKGSATAAVKSATEKVRPSKAAKPQKRPATSKSKSAPAKSRAKPAKAKSTSKSSPKASTKPKKSSANRSKTNPLADIPYQDGSQVWPD